MEARQAGGTSQHAGGVFSAGEDALVLAWSFADLLHAAHASRAGGMSAPPAPLRTWTDHTLPVSALCVGGCGQHDLIASSSADQTLRLWRLADASRDGVYTISLPAALTTIALHPRQKAAYAGGADGQLYAVPLLLTEAGAPGGGGEGGGSGGGHIAASASRAGPVRCITISADGTRLYSCSAESGINK